ncbi:MAG TPA: dihydrolipoamide acetyltransferase family protein [Myxococcales bacterium]|nr:dihydrolipoamide acetyltransferase family protein [Myxococcales bacterium]
MAQFEFKLPDIGEGVVEGEIVKWLVKPGEEVTEDQPLVEVMTDKATVTIPSPRRGKVARLVGKEGETAKVHETLLVLEVDGAGGDVAEQHAPPTGQSAPSLPPQQAGSPAPLSTAPGPARAAQVPAPSAQAAPSGRGGGEEAPATTNSGVPWYGHAPAAPGTSGNGEQQREKVLATPVTRKMAREMGVDLGRVQGTGPLGRVMKTDVLAYVEQQSAPQPQQARRPVPQARPSGGEERIPIRGLRKRIAESMVKSKFTAPHFTFVEECDTKALTALRARLNERLESRGEAKLSYLPFIAKALVAAFRSYPHLNANMDEAKQELVVKNDVNLGFGAATEQGLTVFVVRNVEQLTLKQIGSEIDRLAKAAREQKLAIHELQGGTFTITSLGRDGGILATPIIHHPEVAILGVHKIKQVPVVGKGGNIEIGERMNLSCSFDHRVIDGHIGAAFLYEVIRGLEAPEVLLADV